MNTALLPKASMLNRAVGAAAAKKAAANKWLGTEIPGTEYISPKTGERYVDTKGSRLMMYVVGVVLGIFFIVIMGMVIGVIPRPWEWGESRTSPSPMNNMRVSRVQSRNMHKEEMFTNKPGHGQNRYSRRQLSTNGFNDYGGYYGMHPRGFSQGEGNYTHPMSDNTKLKKAQNYIKNPGSAAVNILSEINMDDDPDYADEVYEEMMENLMAKENRRQTRLSKSINNGISNTGHVEHVNELNTAAHLSASNDFQSPFGTNNNGRNVKRYIQPVESRGVTADRLNFASITK